MIEIVVPESEVYNEETNEFIQTKRCVLKLEHSLVSLSKWESKWHKAFLGPQDKTAEEIADYIRCMSINPAPDYIFNFLTQDDVNKIQDYISNPMTATVVKEIPGKSNNEVVTSELIYYWMVALEIPFECEKWHLNRLLTLIKVCNIKNQPQKKMSNRAILEQNRAINAARRKKFHTKG